MLCSNIQKRKVKTTAQVARGLMVVCTLIVMGRGWALGQAQPQQGNPTQSPGQAGGKELPDAPGETKQESANPVQQVEDKTKQAVDMTKSAAQSQLIRARDWESTWITGVFVGRDQPLITPTRKQREEIYLRQTLTTPGAYLKRMFGAGIDQARGVPWQWERWMGEHAGAITCVAGRTVQTGYAANTLAFRHWGMRSWDTRSDTTSANATGRGCGRGMRLSETF